MTDLLQVSDLEVSFKTEAGKIRAVNGVSYTLGEGRIRRRRRERLGQERSRPSD